MTNTRHERLLQNTKGYKPLLGVGEPKENEGTNGDMRINMTTFGLILYIKYNNQWFSANLNPVRLAKKSKITKLKDATGGTVTDKVDDTQADQKDDVASLAAKINEILDRIG
jgi:hypothetical protein